MTTVTKMMMTISNRTPSTMMIHIAVADNTCVTTVAVVVVVVAVVGGPTGIPSSTAILVQY